MRRLITTDRDDRGGATVFIIIAITAVMIGVGFAIDVGQYVAAARSAQNTADATALAVATDCALTGTPNADYSPYRKPGQTITAPACGSGEATITATKDVDGLFLQQSAGAVDRTATARWGTLETATTIPIVVAKCEWYKQPPSSSNEIIIHLPDTKKQTGCASGPGGFGQLDRDSNSDDPCEVLISSSSTAPGKPGNDLLKAIPCITNPSDPVLPREIMIPIFNDEECPEGGCQGNGEYPIMGFAVFNLTGYSFGPRSGGLPLECDKSIGKNCIRGFFIETTTTQGTPGSSTKFGVTKVYLYS
jgi:Flp pilus assembly protein TadG